MDFFEYINCPKDLFEKAYIDTGLVQRGQHDTFPLDIYTYGRKTVTEDAWDGVTSKCRGIIVHRGTGIVIARPFEKFHNYGSKHTGTLPVGEGVVQEKLDGFMVTGYHWEGKWYAASKGSFHSIHAKWATAEIQKHPMALSTLWTPVFEGLHPDLRIVVDYGDRIGLVLLALIRNEDGFEARRSVQEAWARHEGFEIAENFPFSLEEATEMVNREGAKGEEGFVVVWPSLIGPPTRVKLKFVDYLRLHRLVTGVSPKRIWEAISQPHLAAEIDEFMNHSTPWFKEFTEKWVRALRERFDEYQTQAKEAFQVARVLVREQEIRYSQEHGDTMPFAMLRKAYAAEFTKHSEISAILFSMLDGKDASVAIWKKVKKVTESGHPLRDAIFN
jgi:RNA ligase